MKILMFYELAPGGLAKAEPHYAAHVARLQEFHKRGELLMAGPYGNPPAGVVAKHRLEEWNEVLHRA